MAVENFMVDWALRCLLLTVIIGLTFIGVKESRLIPDLLERKRHAVEAQSAPLTEQASQGGYLEEIIMAGGHGHFIADVTVNGTLITFLVDTGASHTVLRREDAERLSLGSGQLRYSVPFQSANGTTYAAPITLRDVRLGQFQLYDLDAFVNQGELGISLLGMSFLRQFESYEFLKDRLVLRW